MHILLVEFDKMLRKKMLRLFYPEYEVLEAEECNKAKVLFKEKKPDLCILDVNLKDGSGYELCHYFRTISDVLVLFVTVRDDEESIVQGLEVGGDDYITKPFSSRELLSRIKALLRRSSIKNQGEKQIFYTGDYIFDKYGQIYYKDRKEIELSATELQIVKLLLCNSGCLITRECMIDKIWDVKGNFVEDNTLTVNVSRLRKKLGTFEGIPYIKTVKGIGYRWNVPVIEKSNE